MIRKETYDLYYISGDLDDFQEAISTILFRQNPTAKEVSVNHELIDPQEGKMKATISFEIDL